MDKAMIFKILLILSVATGLAACGAESTSTFFPVTEAELQGIFEAQSYNVDLTTADQVKGLRRLTQLSSQAACTDVDENTYLTDNGLLKTDLTATAVQRIEITDLTYESFEEVTYFYRRSEVGKTCRQNVTTGPVKIVDGVATLLSTDESYELFRITKNSDGSLTVNDGQQ